MLVEDPKRHSRFRRLFLTRRIEGSVGVETFRIALISNQQLVETSFLQTKPSNMEMPKDGWKDLQTKMQIYPNQKYKSDGVDPGQQRFWAVASVSNH